MISNLMVKKTYLGNGTTTLWPIPFSYTDKAQILALITTDDVETEITDFTIDTDADTLLYPKTGSALATGTTITIYRSTGLTQRADMENQGGAWPTTIEAGLDKLTQMVQEVNESVSRAVKTPMSSATDPDTLLATLNTNASRAVTSAVESADNAATAAEAASKATGVLGGATTALYESTGAGIISGFDATISGSTINIKAGTAHMITGYRETSADTTITPNIADATNPRIDLIYLSSAGVVSYLAGIAAVSPAIPSVPDGGLGLWGINVGKDGTLALVDLRDKKYNDIRKSTYKSLYKTMQDFNSSTGLFWWESQHQTEDTARIIASMGFKIVRTDVRWWDIERSPGIYNFSRLLQNLAWITKHGMKAQITFMSSNALYGGAADEAAHLNTTTLRTGYANAFKALATAVINAGYAGQIFDVWNEPNNRTGADAFLETDYVETLKLVYPSLKAIDPTCTVMACSTSNGGGNMNGLPWLRNVFAAGGLDYMDVLGIHPYAYEQHGPETKNFFYPILRDIISQYSKKDITIWISEVGYHTSPQYPTTGAESSPISDAVRAKYEPRLLLNALANGINMTNIHCAHNFGESTNPAFSEAWFGIIHDDGTTLTATALAIKALNDLLNGYSYAGVYYQSSTAYILQFMNKNGEFIYIGWTVNSNETVYVNGETVSLTDTATVITAITNDELCTQKYLTPVNYGTNEIFGDKENGHVNGDYNIKAGYSQQVDGNNNAVFGMVIKHKGNYGVSTGYNNTADGDYVSVFGLNNFASKGCFAIGIANASILGRPVKISAVTATTFTLDESDIPSIIAGTVLYVKSDWGTVFPIIVAMNAGPIITVATTQGITVGSIVIIPSDSSGGASTMGCNNITAGAYSTTGGVGCVNAGVGSITHGVGLWNRTSFPTAIFGNYNKKQIDDNLMIIGNGASVTARNNAFRVANSGAVFSTGAYNTTGADYAEYFEWSDENTDAEDRVGYFATFDTGLKIRKAKSTDNYILGIISGAPSVIGNSYQDDWSDKYVKDNFGRIQYEEIEFAALTDIDGNIMKPSYMGLAPKISANYDTSKEYTPREKRKEWSAVGMLGQLAVYDDGTCTVDSYCKPSDDGKATAAVTGYRVIERISSNVIKILFR